MLKRSIVFLNIIVLFFPVFSQQRVKFEDERRIARRVRSQAAFKQTIERPIVHTFLFHNEQEENVKDYAGSFTKLLEHNQNTSAASSQGQANYYKLLTALHADRQLYFNQIGLSPESIRKYVNPQNSYAFTLEGCDSALFKMPSPPKLSSQWAACEMLEVYLQAICRDVHFEDYGTGQGSDSDGMGGSLTDTAAQVLDAFGIDYFGPRNAQGQVDASVLFRGTGNGPLIGPYVSQFLYLPIHKIFQPLLKQNQFVPIASQREFGVAWNYFIGIQNGAIPQPYNEFDFDQNNLRYPITGRDVGTYVHNDGPYEAYFYALNVLIFYGFPFAANLPYYNGNIKNEAAFNTMGVPDVFGIIATTANEALKAAWCQKWRLFRRLRPEAMAGLIHYTKTSGNNPYNLNQSIFNPPGGTDVLQMVFNHNEQQASLPHNSIPLADAQTYLLGLMYPEGSPAHPSYPAGHAVLAGACTTVIKALIDDQALIRDFVDPVKPNPNDPTKLVLLVAEGENHMTVASELDKLASNIALARDFAGVHYRSDGDYGILLGEEVAIRLLEDHARIYTEQGFDGFELTKRNGQRIKITPDGVKNI